MRWGLWIRNWRLQGATRSGRKDRNQTKRLLARKSSNCRGSWDEYIGSGDLLRVAGVEGCDERLGLSSNSVARLRRSLGVRIVSEKIPVDRKGWGWLVGGRLYCKRRARYNRIYK